MFEVFLWDKPGPRPPHSLAPRLAKLVKSMQKLEEFTLVIPEYHTEVFAPHFKDIVLPEVETLVVGPYVTLLSARVRMCRPSRATAGLGCIRTDMDMDIETTLTT